MSIDPRRTQPFCTPRCWRECRCSRWPDYENRFGWPVRPGATYADKVLATGPIAYWLLNETAGATAADQVNSPLQDGTAVGVAWANDATGPFGTPAPFFDGANDYVDIATATFLNAFSGTLGTVAYWIRATDWDMNGMSLTILRDAANRIFIQHFLGVASDITFYFIAGGVNANASIPSATMLPLDNTWVHLAMTWNQASNRMRIFLNGVQQGADVAVGLWAGVPGTAVIGAYTIVPASVITGWEAHVAVWDTELAPATILELASP